VHTYNLFCNQINRNPAGEHEAGNATAASHSKKLATESGWGTSFWSLISCCSQQSFIIIFAETHHTLDLLLTKGNPKEDVLRICYNSSGKRDFTL